MQEVKISPKIFIEHELNGQKETVDITSLLSEAVSVLLYFKKNIPELAHAQAVKEEPLIETEELAKYLNKSASSIRNWKRQELIPYYKVGRSIFYKKSEVEKALKEISTSELQIIA